MSIRNIIKNLRKKEVSPRVYSLVFKDKHTDSQVLWTVVAYSLEEAIGKSKRQMESEFQNQNKNVDVSQYKLDMFNWERPEDLLAEYLVDGNPQFPELGKKLMQAIEEMSGAKKLKLVPKKEETKPAGETPPESPDKQRSKLMEKIIKDRDVKLFEENRGQFKKAETLYLEEKLKTKK